MTKFLKLGIFFVATLLSGLALVHQGFRDAEGILQGTACLAFSASAALLILAWGLATAWQQATCWLSLALMGQGIALQLIEAGSGVRYQHYLPLEHLITQDHALLLGYILIQSIVVLSGIRARWGLITETLSRSINLWQAIGIGLIFVLSTATVSRDISRYITEIIFATFLQAINLGNIVLMVWALPEETLIRVKRKFGSVIFWNEAGGRKKEEKWCIEPVVLIAACWVIALAVLLNYFAYERHPHLQDEVGYLLQAQSFAGGYVKISAPTVREAFDIYLMQFKGDSWFAITPPGWPAILALGVALGIPWLINPLLAGLNVILAYVFLRDVYDQQVARWSLLLLSFSPWHIFMAMNFMTHTFTLTCALVGLIGIAWARNSNKLSFGLTAGAAAGMASLVRPLDGVIVGGVLGLSALGIGGERLRARAFIGLVVGTIIIGSMTLPFNKALTGSPFVFPLMAYMDQYFTPGSNAYGFGSEQGWGWAIDPFPGHSPIEGFINANLNISSLNSELFGWSTGSLIFVALLLFSKSFQRTDHQMLLLTGSVFIAYFFYWFSGGPDFGPRYWFLMLLPMVTLTARGVQALIRIAESGSSPSFIISTRVMIGVASLCFLTLINYFPWRAIDKYHHYLNMRPEIRTLARQHNFGKSLVLIRGRSFPDYVSAIIYNPLDFNAHAPIYAWDKDPHVRAKLIDAYSDRPIWLIDGPSITHRGFEVVRGPVTRSDLVLP